MKGCLIILVLGLCILTLIIGSSRQSAPAETAPTLAVLPSATDLIVEPSVSVATATPESGVTPTTAFTLTPLEIAASPTETVLTREPARTMNGVMLVPVTPRYDLMTQNAALATEMQSTREAYANPPTITPLPLFTATPLLAPVSSVSMTVYAQGSVNLRACPRRDCEFVGALYDGEAITVSGETTGDAVMGSNNRWYRVQFGGRDAYVYSEIVTNRPPTSVPIYVPPPTINVYVPDTSSANSGVSGGFVCPKNCDGAKAMGLSAVQAASCPGLDRDHDGVACYGD